ncbi:MAG: Obg family GTPase CgtA, partial [Actinomycetes bacterium]
TLLHELGEYRPELLDRPRLVVGSRADLADDDAADSSMDMVISAVTRVGLDDMIGRLGTLVFEARRAEVTQVDTEIRIHRPAEQVVHVARMDDGSFHVLGRAAQRAVRFSTLTDDGALDEAVKRLERLGVDRLLSRAGIHEGDTVVVGDLEFSWWRGQATEGLNPAELPRRPKRKRPAQ